MKGLTKTKKGFKKWNHFLKPFITYGRHDQT